MAMFQLQQMIQKSVDATIGLLGYVIIGLLGYVIIGLLGYMIINMF